MDVPQPIPLHFIPSTNHRLSSRLMHMLIRISMLILRDSRLSSRLSRDGRRGFYSIFVKKNTKKKRECIHIIPYSYILISILMCTYIAMIEYYYRVVGELCSKFEQR